MTPLTLPIDLGDQTYHARLTVPQLAELERKRQCPAGAILARLLTGVYLDDQGNIADASLMEAGFFDADISEVIYHGLVGGQMVDPMRAREIVRTYVEDMPRKDSWLKAAAIMRAYMVGFTPPKKAPAPKADDPPSPE